jgi:hypothetical protein
VIVSVRASGVWGLEFVAFFRGMIRSFISLLETGICLGECNFCQMVNVQNASFVCLL